MIPMRHSTIFKSRWMALVWSAGILWTAVDVAGRGDDSAPANGSDNAASATADDQPLNVAEFDETRKLVDQLNAK